MLNHSSRSSPETRLSELGLVLPTKAPHPIGAFRNVRQHGDLLYISGQGPVHANGRLERGKVGGDVTAEQARVHAELVALNILAVLNDHLGGLDAIGSVIKLLGLVNAVPEFERHPYVIDGASELLRAVFGADGVHARSAFGVTSLPNQITVEVEAILAIKPGLS